jgi:nitrogen fixation-related uncharacterized protein
MELKKLALPISIIMGAIILGGFYYVVQSDNQESVEKQQLLELSEKRANADKDREVELYKLRSPKCDELARNFKEEIDAYPDDGNRYVYSSADDRCVYESFYESDGYMSSTLKDLFTGTTLADLWWRRVGHHFHKSDTLEDCLNELDDYLSHSSRYFDEDRIIHDVCKDGNTK